MNDNKIDIYSPRVTYKPFDKLWAYEAWQQHKRVHWMGEDIRLDVDVSDYASAPTGLKFFIEKLMLIFTQMDVDVGEFYTKYICNTFPKPEIRMMATGFADRESEHMFTYSLFSDTVGIGDKAYTDFLNIEELRAKHDLFVDIIRTIDDLDTSRVLKDYLRIVIYSGFGEGVSLFTSFGMLLSLSMPEINKFPGLETIVNYSIRDENIHYSSMLKLAKEEIYTHLSEMDKSFVKEFVSDFAYKLFRIELAFIKYIFLDTGITHITVDDMVDYLVGIINRRGQYLFSEDFILDTCQNCGTKIQDWINFKVGDVHEQFFEVKATAYGKGGINYANVKECNFSIPEILL
jgi:ribonucleoside-diphosphate reductase beta chain